MKKITALLLAFTMFIAAAPPSFAAEKGIPAGYIPIRNAALISGGTVEFKEGNIALTYQGTSYLYNDGSVTAHKNGAEISLSYPVAVIGDTAYGHYDDFAYLFDSDGMYPESKKTVVTTAYMLMRSYNVPGVSFAFTDSETGYSWLRSFGHADIEAGKTADPNDLYSLASISKVFTAMAIMRLCQEGKLDLNQKLTYYLPELNIAPHPVYGGDFRDINLKMLLSHVSGIPSDIFQDFYSKNSYIPDYMNDFIENINQLTLDIPPLTRWYYSNSGYVLLGIIAARVAGYDDYFHGYAQYAKENLLNVMAMENSSFILSDDHITKIAAPYQTASDTKAERLFVNPLPAGGLYSNAVDMVRFMNFMLNRGEYEGIRLLEPASVDIILNPSGYDMRLNPQINMSLGTYQSEFAGLKMSGHGGDIAFYHSDFQLSPENKVGVFTAANSSSSVLLSSTLNAYAIKSFAEEKTGAVLPFPQALETSDITMTEPSPHAGYYTSIGKISATEDNKLYLDDHSVVLVPQSDGSFYSPLLGRVWFKNVNGIDVLALGDQSNVVIGEKIFPQKAVDGFERWVGTYFPEDTGSNGVPVISRFDVTISSDGIAAISFVTNDLNTSAQMALGHISDNTYYILGTARNHGKTFKFYEENGKRYMEAYGMKLICS